jgi:ornithine lipid ester-linked acyl 2-hydroxylase
MSRPRFHPVARFPFAAVLEANAGRIRAEFAAVRDRMIDWVERDLYGEGWKVFGLYDFPRGEPLADGVRACPETAALIAAHIPTHGAAGFSLLRPGTRIQPHEGLRGDFLRCHLALEVPAGDCGLRIGSEVRRWEAERTIIFDDRLMHEAWNLTGRDRVVLLVDFVP